MIKALFLALALCGVPDTCIQESHHLPTVEEEVDFVSVAHMNDDWKLIFFFAEVQGDMSLLDYRAPTFDMTVSRIGEYWYIAWEDWNSGNQCYRVIKTKHWLESWETENPLEEMQARPWLAQLIFVGLKQPPK